jgi:hypothetical protein
MGGSRFHSHGPEVIQGDLANYGIVSPALLFELSMPPKRRLIEIPSSVRETLANIDTRC